MSSDFNPLLWFVCKICRQAFPDTDKLKKHQIRKHAEDCKNVKCIVFEERFFDKQWIPSDNYFPESNSEFTNENLIEVAPLTSKCGCHCHSILTVSAETQTESYLQPLIKHKPNPFVFLKRLTSTELNDALNRNTDKPIFQSSCSSDEIKRTSRCLNNKDVQSPKQTKEYFYHEENHQDPDEDLRGGQNIFVSSPEIVQNLVTQTEELSTRVLPEPVELSLTGPFSANSCSPHSSLIGIENVQNPEENRLEEAIGFTLLEGEIHVELLSVIKDKQSLTEHPDPGNQLLPKTNSHKGSPLAAEKQKRIGAKYPSKPGQGPYVLLKRLTFEGLDTAITQNSEKVITKSTTRCKGRKRFREDYNQSPPANENCLPHGNQEKDDPAGENNSVCNPELFQEIFVPKAEPDRDAFSTDGQFSSIISLSDPPVNALTDIKYVANIQNTEENDEELSTRTQTLEYQEQHSEGIGSCFSKKIWCSRSDPNNADTSTFEKPSVSNFGSLNSSQVNNNNESLSETNHAEPIPIIGDVYSQALVTEDICPSDSECFEMENPISPGLSDEVEFVEEQHLPTSVVSEIGVSDDNIELTQGSDTKNTQFDGQPHSNEERNENTVCTTSSACPIPFSALTATHASPELESLDTSKNVLPRYNTRAKRKKPEINYSESHICSRCNHDFDSFDDLQDHQRLCVKHNRVDSVIISDKNSLKVSLISSSANSGKVKKITSTVTDGDSDYAIAGDEGISDSDSENDNYVLKPMPVAVSDQELPKIVETLSGVTTATAPHPKAKERKLALFEWLDAQKGARFEDGSTNKICLLTEMFCSTKRLGPKNVIKCKLCKTNLTTELHLLNHVQNCWLHNQSNHCFCVSCGKSFRTPQGLAYHFQNPTYEVKHAEFRRKNGPHFLDAKSAVNLEEDHQRLMPLNDSGPQPTVPVSGDSRWSCTVCHKVLTTKFLFNAHQKSLKIFRGKSSRTESIDFLRKADPDVDSRCVELWKTKTNKNPAPTNILLLCQSLNVDSLDVNLENPVTCKLCETKLVSTLDVKLHSENCWLHNKIRHVFCTICDERFDDAAKLRDHNSNQHQLLKPFAPSEDENNRTEPENNLSLRHWLTIHQEIDPKNIIALEPDPLKSEAVIVTDSSPVKCKLCEELLTTEAALKTHITTCWLHNKAKHCYCIPCNLNFATNSYLLVHNQAKHLNQTLTALTCLKCNHEFHTESESAKHNESLRRFLNKRKKTKSPHVVKWVSSTGGSNTMAYLFEWLKGRRHIKNLDGSENIILVDPEPTADNFDGINSENPITCRLCQQKFTTAIVLRNHIRDCWTRNKGSHRFCLICEKAFKKPQHLQDHSKMEHSEMQKDSFTCAFCDQEFFDEKTIEEHEEAHKDPNFLPFKCPHCSESFTDKNILLKHVTAVHKGLKKVAGHKCKICLKSFPAPNMLNDHNRSAHTGERPFICKFPNCSFACSIKGYRELHYRIKHREESGLEPQQFPCPTCGKTFKENFLLTTHLRRSHTQDRAYKCTHQGCTKAFKTSTQLTEHVRDHTGEKPYVCEECGKSFARKWGFIKHKRSHAGTLNRAQCHLCPRKFLGGWELKQHLKVHEERKKFKCQFCEVICVTQSYLKKHEKTHGNKLGSNSEDDDDDESSADSNV